MPKDIYASALEKSQVECNNMASINLFHRQPLRIAILLCGLYLITIWTMNISICNGYGYLFNLLCYLIIMAIVLLFGVWMRQVGIYGNRLAMAGWVLILVLIMGSMTIRKGTIIYVSHDFHVQNYDCGINKGKFYYSVISALGVRKTMPFGKHGTYQGYTYPTLGFIADGVFIDFYDNGVKMEEGRLENRILRGTYCRWYDTGQINLRAEFSNGKPNGHVCVWNEDGTKWSEGNFTKGKPTKDWVYYSVKNPEGIKEPYDFCKALHLEGETDERYRWLAFLFGIKTTSNGGRELPWFELGSGRFFTIQKANDCVAFFFLCHC